MSKKYLDQNGLAYFWQKIKSYIATHGGSGDMYKSTYDTNNSGVVDNAEKLGGIAPSGFMQLSKFKFENLIQLDGGSKSLSAGTSWTQPYTTITGSSKNVIVVPAGKYIVSVSTRITGLTSGNQYGVGISYRYTDESTWYTLTRGRQLIRVYGTVTHHFTGVAMVTATKEIAFTLSTYHQAAATLTDSIVSVFGFAD